MLEIVLRPIHRTPVYEIRWWHRAWSWLRPVPISWGKDQGLMTRGFFYWNDFEPFPMSLPK